MSTAKKNELAVRDKNPSVEAIEQVLIKRDLTDLTPQQRVLYYKSLCESLKLNWMTQPFGYIVLNGKLTLYAMKDCTDQLRRIFDVSIIIVKREMIEGCYVVTAQAKLPSGRQDEATGVVALGHLKGDALANAYMKAETKAKRRVTLSIIGLGFVDESEIHSIKGARVVDENYDPNAWRATKEQRKLLAQAMLANGHKKQDLIDFTKRFKGGSPNSLEEFNETLLAMSQSKVLPKEVDCLKTDAMEEAIRAMNTRMADEAVEKSWDAMNKQVSALGM